MNTLDVVVVRVYITESSHLLKKIISYLKNDAKIRGVSVFRAISGFGETGDHNTSLIFHLIYPLPLNFLIAKIKWIWLWIF